jgi:hypothetical protein
MRGFSAGVLVIRDEFEAPLFAAASRTSGNGPPDVFTDIPDVSSRPKAASCVWASLLPRRAASFQPVFDSLSGMSDRIARPCSSASNRSILSNICVDPGRRQPPTSLLHGFVRISRNRPIRPRGSRSETYRSCFTVVKVGVGVQLTRTTSAERLARSQSRFAT